ncbi:hypothetical protein ABT336_11800 [Micromonospora sp. NPDC000207]|uniref:hypothetical protein n=1 Tax=Micromonospora sp. NPDC000207 TaxID=3154246 RepID=UPI003329061A
MGKLEAAVAYRERFLAAGGSSGKNGRAWQLAGINPRDAAELESKGYTPEAVKARIDAQPIKWGDERDAEAAIDAMLDGPPAN